MQKIGSRGKNIDYSKYCDYNLDRLSDREKEMLLLKIQGKTFKEISELYGITQSRVGQILYIATQILDNKYTRKKGCNLDYSKYYGYNLDNLTKKEKAYMQLRIDGENESDIADMYNVSVSTVNTTLLRARRKLDSGYVHKRNKKTEKPLVIKKYDYTKYFEYNLDSLTNHQRDILYYKMQGKKNIEIASIYGVSPDHISNILSIIRKKLDNVCDKNNVKSNKNKSIKECLYPSLECLPKKFIKVFMMSQSGLSVEEIVKKEKISRDSINNILYLCNLKINSSDGKG